MNKTIEEILTSNRSLNDESSSFSLALYFALDIDNKFYHYQANSSEKFIVQLVEFYLNQLASIDVYGVTMFSRRPIHLLKYKHPDKDTKSTLIFYSNGAVCIDQGTDSEIIHVWVEKELIDLYNIPKPEELQQD